MTGLVLLHGVGLDHRMWQRCLPRLEAERPVHTPDLPGHGTAGPMPSGWELADMASAVAEGFSAPAHLVGFSLGALVAQRIALDRPALVRSLTLVSSVAERDPEQRRAVADRLETAERDFEATADKAVARWMSPEWRAVEPELAEQLRTTLCSQHRPSYLRCYRIFAEADRELAPLLPRIASPTLAVTGSQDPGSTPAMAELLGARIPRAQARILPDVRHLVPMQAPDVLVDAILSHIKEVERAATAET